MKYLLPFCLALLLCCGCGRPKPIGPVAQPDLAPLTEVITSAKGHIDAAQKNVQEVLTAAKGSDAPIAKQAVPPLSAADTQLTSANTDLDTAKSEVATLKTAHTVSAKQIEKLLKENRELRDESLSTTKNWLIGIGIFLLLIGAGGFISIFAVGFLPGKYVGAFAMPLGCVCLAIAKYLSQILLGTIIGVIAATLGVLAYTAWKLLQHEPYKRPKATGIPVP